MTKKFRRNHNIRHVKQSEVYKVEDICVCLGVHPQAVYTWLKNGLESIIGSYPRLVHGSKLADFLQRQKEARRIICKENEFYCFKCRAARIPLPDSITHKQKNERVVNLKAICGVCGCKMFKATSLHSNKNTF